MSLRLTPEIEAMVRSQVETGLYSDPDQVIREALELLAERNRHRRLQHALAIGDEEYRRGEGIPWTPDTLDRLTREADEEDRQGLPISDDVQP
jgi:putative addiction module CopG family antidote